MGARVWTEGQLRARAIAFYPPATTADAEVRSFPFLGRLVTSGRVRYVSLSLEGLQATDVVRLRRLTFAVRGAELDRGELLRRRVRLVSIESGRLEALIDGPSLGRALGVELSIRPEGISVRREIGGEEVSVDVLVTIDDGIVKVRPRSVVGLGVPASVLTFTYRLPDSLLPCEPSVQGELDALLVACEVSELPPGFAGKRITRPAGPR